MRHVIAHPPMSANRSLAVHMSRADNNYDTQFSEKHVLQCAWCWRGVYMGERVPEEANAPANLAP